LVCLLGQRATISCCAQEAAALLTPEEVLRRYESNRRQLWPARVTWTYTMAHGPMVKADYRAHAAELRKKAAENRHLSPKERAELLVQARNEEKSADDPNALVPTVILQDFWTDGRAFQRRIPPAKPLPAGWSFPDVAANEQTLLNELLEIEITSAPDGPEMGVRSWAGDAGRRVGNVNQPLSPWLNGQLPPLALAVFHDVNAAHPFDQFFAAPVAQLAVVG
jgi:hypothetical protein